MRSEKDMYELILRVAREDERIRAVYMNGSRANPNVTKDIFQDFDVVYVVTQTSSFLKDVNWINIFGDLIMLQEPDKLDDGIGIKTDFERTYGYLMLFKDGNRIDLHIQTKALMLEEYGKDRLTIPLLDKDSCLPQTEAPTDTNYHVRKPTEAQYISCMNNFWWCLQNVAKGIWRDELPYAKRMFEENTRVDLNEMVSWWIGINYDFRVSTGKMGKYFKKYLPESYWEIYEQTYSDSEIDNFWNSIFITCNLFRVLSKDVAEHFSFTYPDDDNTNMTQYLKHVRTLPRDARDIY